MRCGALRFCELFFGPAPSSVDQEDATRHNTLTANTSRSCDVLPDKTSNGSVSLSLSFHHLGLLFSVSLFMSPRRNFCLPPCLSLSISASLCHTLSVSVFVWLCPPLNVFGCKSVSQSVFLPCRLVSPCLRPAVLLPADSLSLCFFHAFVLAFLLSHSCTLGHSNHPAQLAPSPPDSSVPAMCSHCIRNTTEEHHARTQSRVFV